MTRINTVYISGDRGETPDYLERFESAENLLISAGFKVINPATLLKNASKCLSKGELMELSIAMLLQCDAIYMLKGFNKSDDSKNELKIAEKNEIVVMYESNIEFDEIIQKALVNRYAKGTKLKLIEMVNDPFPVKPGSIGEVKSVDDAGTIHMHWDSGSSLGLIPGVDKFVIFKESENEL